MSENNENQSAYTTKSVEQNEELQTGILNELHTLQKKTLMYQRITAILMLVFVIAVLCVVPSLLSTLKATRDTLAGVDAAVAEAETAINEVEAAMNEVQTSMQDLSTFVDGAGKDLTAVTEGINKVDFDSLNDAIQNLDATVEPLAKFFNKFR